MQPTSHTDYLAAFRTEIEKLNDAQRAAVDQIDGPVMVLAGPGTGKTHLLSARIGNILLQTDARANNILCLTYTEAGVRAMRERLLGMIGPEAHRVNIYTFHGFCSMVIQDNLEYFGRPRLEPLSDLERIRTIRQMIDELDVHHPLRLGRGNGYFYERHLYWLFNTMKNENWSDAQIHDAIDSYVLGLNDHPDFTYKRKYKQFQKGDPISGRIEPERHRMQVLKSALPLFNQYQQRLDQLARYDYSDMIQWVLKAFNKYPILLRSYQERYFYLLVDEFQDTNGAQHELVRLLADFWDNPNIFIVGDDDQSIYEFQGARLDTMIDFHRRYRDPALITLTENYRSSQEILDAATKLIDANKLRIVNQLSETAIIKQLKAANTSLAQHKNDLRLLEFPDRTQENAGVLQQIRQWKAEGIGYEEMAIIYATHSQADGLQQLLAAAGIPYYSKRPINVLDETPIRQLRQLLTYFQRELEQPFSGAHELYQLLHYPCFGHQPLDLAKIAIKRAKDKEASWREYLNAIPPADAAELQAAEDLLRTGAWLEESLLAAVHQPLIHFIEKVLNESGLLAHYTKSADRARQLALFSSFLDFIREELIRRPRLDLAELLITLDNMDANRIGIPLRHQLVKENALTLVTAHSAKGLEFECVWMLDASDKDWDGKKGGRKDQFKLPDTLTLTLEASQTEARRRLFFVAMTRAKKSLRISYARLNDKEKPQTPSLFVSELLEQASISLEEASVNRAALDKILPLRLGIVDTKQFLPHYEVEAIQELLAHYRLSVSGFNRYIQCPLSFFYETILRVPSRQREQATFGEALHEALQDYFLRMLADPTRVFPGSSELQFYFEQAMERRRSQFSKKQFKDRLTQGKRELAAYYEKHRTTWTVQSRVEQSIRDAELKGVPLTGTIDRIDFIDDFKVNIWDYKSGSHDDERIKPPRKAEPHGGSYWRQLVFYKLLYENRLGNSRKVIQAGISYLVMDKTGNQPNKSIELNQEALDFVSKLIVEVWENIQNQQFNGCGKEDCAWCNFVQNDLKIVPQTKELIEGLDDKS